jgi:hypothetical protein
MSTAWACKRNFTAQVHFIQRETEATGKSIRNVLESLPFFIRKEFSGQKFIQRKSLHFICGLKASSFQSFSVWAIQYGDDFRWTNQIQGRHQRRTKNKWKEHGYLHEREQLQTWLCYFNQIIQVRQHEWLYNLRIVL